MKHSFAVALTGLVTLWIGTALTGAAPASGQDADDVYWDWPVGLCVDQLFVPGYGYTIQQDFANEYNNVSYRCGLDEAGNETGINCWHAGLDIFRNRTGDDRDDTRTDPVFAAADGRVVAVTNWGGVNSNGLGYGYGVLVEHDVPPDENGVVDPIYAQYLHLQTVAVEVEERVRRGQPLGTISQYPDAADHLHFETRPTLRVKHCPETTTNCVAANIKTSCRGNGYSLIADGLGDQLDDWRFDHPVDTYFGNRPPFPADVITDLNPQIYSMTDVDSTEQGIFPLGEWGVADSTPRRVTPDPDDPIASQGTDEAWYDVTYRVDEDTTREGFVQSYVHSADFLATIAIGERVRVGREWQAPSEDPVVDFRFGDGCTEADETCCLTDEAVINHAPGSPNGAVSGTICQEPPYGDLVAGFCDKVAPFTDVSEPVITLGTAAEVNFRGGVALEVALRLDSSAGDQLIAARGEEGTEAWKLAVADGSLVFTARYANGNTESLEYALPNPACRTNSVAFQCTCVADSAEDECDGVYQDFALATFYPNGSTAPLDCSTVDTACNTLDTSIPRGCIDDYGYQQWRHVAVAATADPDGEQTMRLYWDGAEVDEQDLPRQLGDDLGELRVGENLEGSLDNLRIWAYPAEEEEVVQVDSVLIIDSSGSMATYDPVNQRKNAAYVYFDVSPEDDRVGVVDFDSDAKSISLKSLADAGQKQQLETWVRTEIDSSGLTDITDGVAEGCDVLMPAATDDTIKTGILLTDGISPWNDDAKECFLQEGWTLHALGFGGADDGLLGDVVEGTGGEALVLPNAQYALCELQQIRARVVGGTEIPCEARVIQPYGNFFYTEVVLPEHDYLASFSAWEGSDVVMSLESPSGRIIDRDTASPDVVHRAGPTYEMYRVNGPEPGTWRFHFFGADIPPGGEEVVYGGSLFSAVPGPGTPGGGGNSGAPDVSAAVPSVGELWPPNHKMTDVEILGVTDPQGQNVTITFLSVTQDEPVAGPGQNSAPDAEGLGTPIASLRAERDGNGNGRVYEITFEARDAGGAAAVGSVRVCVPHDRGGEPCIDDGQAYDSTLP